MAADIFEYLRQSPPRCLSAFGTTLKDEIVQHHMRSAAFEVSCGNCKGATFKLGILARDWKEDAQPSEIGVAAMCSGCGRREILFDGTRCGYDGEHGHLAFIKGGDVETPLEDGRTARVRVEFIYNNEMTDLLKDAAALSKSPQDFFDWFHVSVSGLGPEDWTDVWEFECA